MSATLVIIVSVVIPVLVTVLSLILNRHEESAYMKKLNWENTPPISTVITEERIGKMISDINRNGGIEIYDRSEEKTLVPLICSRCGGEIDKETNRCKHCNTEFVWK